MSNVLVLHTTEGSSFSGAKNWLVSKGIQPHWLVDPKAGVFEQLLDLNRGGKALKNLSGGVETNNRGGIYQMEIVGFAAEVPTYSDEWYHQLASWVRRACQEANVPLLFPYKFDGSQAYGRTKGSVRLTNRQWLDVSGIVGHQHVPENSHWDPGNISRLIPFVQAQAKSNIVVEVTDPDKPVVLKKGVFSDAVADLQTVINTMFGYGLQAPLRVDGDFGQKTEDALIDIQKALGVTVDGIYGNQTRRAMATVQDWVEGLEIP